MMYRSPSDKLSFLGLCVLAGVGLTILLYLEFEPTSLRHGIEYIKTTGHGKYSQDDKEFADRVVEESLNSLREELAEVLSKQVVDIQNKLDDGWRAQKEELAKVVETKDEEFKKFKQEKADKERKDAENRAGRQMVHDQLDAEYNKALMETEEWLLRFIPLNNTQKEKTPGNIVIVSGCDATRRQANRTRFEEMQQNRQSYAQRQGYTYQFVETDAYSIEGESPAWGKLAAIHKAFNDNPTAEWIWWLDDDALIVNQDFNVAEQLLNPIVLEQRITWGRPVKDQELFFSSHLPFRDEVGHVEDTIDIVITQDRDGWNAGSMFLRRSESMPWILDMWDDKVYREQGLIHDEQSTLVHLAFNHPKIAERIGTVPQRMINSYCHEAQMYQPGDFVIHFAGTVKERDDYPATWSKFYNQEQNSEPKPMVTKSQ